MQLRYDERVLPAAEQPRMTARFFAWRRGGPWRREGLKGARVLATGAAL